MKQSNNKLSYLPIAINNCKELVSTETADELKGIYPCPCCECRTFPVPKEDAIAFICPVCFWENDIFISSDHEPSDENHGMTLNEGRRNYKAFGACCQKNTPSFSKKSLEVNSVSRLTP